jgi:DNA-binding MarR family transcriptional regulator
MPSPTTTRAAVQPGHLDDELRIAIMRLARRLRLQRGVSDITDGQLSVLFALAKFGAQTLGSLSELERVTPPSMSRTVGALEGDSLVTRSASPDDGRKVLIEITPTGLAIVQETKQRRAAWFSTALGALTEEQRQALDAAAPVLRELADS